MKYEYPTLSLSQHMKVIVFFTILAAIYSFPLLSDLSGMPSGDGYMNAHGFWWFREALSSFRNPFYTDYFFYPQGANLAFYGGTAFTGFLLTLPVSFLAGVNEAVNIAHFLGYLLCGYFTFLLAHEFTDDTRAAIVAGVIFAFIPYHVFSVPVHMILSSLQWIPLYLLLFWRTLISEEKKWAFYAGLALAAIILNDQMQTIMTFLVTVAAIICFVVCRSGETNVPGRGFAVRAMGGRLLLMVGVAVVASSFYLYPLAEFLLNDHNALKVGPFDHGGANQFSADVIGYVVPPTTNPILGKSFPSVSFTWRNQLFLGYLPLFLALIGSIAYFKKGMVRFLMAATVIAVVLSIGVTLHVNGVWQLNDNAIKLPFFYLSDLPLFSSIRTPYRFHPLTALGVALLASYGALRILRHQGWIEKAGYMTFGIVTVILLEFFPASNAYPKAAPVPKIYREMAKDRDVYTVLELPLSRWTSLLKNGSGSPAVMMYYQSVHGKRVFNGFVSRVPEKTMDFGNGLLDTFTEITTYDNYGITGKEKRVANVEELAAARKTAESLAPIRDSFFRTYNIRYIVLHAPIAYRGSLSRTFVESFCSRQMIDVPEDGLAYIRVQ